jgi:hypothetical protein
MNIAFNFFVSKTSAFKYAASCKQAFNLNKVLNGMALSAVKLTHAQKGASSRSHQTILFLCRVSHGSRTHYEWFLNICERLQLTLNKELQILVFSCLQFLSLRHKFLVRIMF